MIEMRQAAEEFLGNRRIAVTGVSRKPAGHGSNAVFQRLLDRGYEAIPVNPNATEISGVACYPDLASIPGGVEAVVIGTAPEHAQATVEQAAELGIAQVWMHRSYGGGSVSEEAAAWGREHGVRVIVGGCPLMFEPVADGGHKFMCRLFTLLGKVPKEV
ncbi:MAG: CoA-binding protein [Candidatus Nanopelagicales bacterium]